MSLSEFVRDWAPSPNKYRRPVAPHHQYRIVNKGRAGRRAEASLLGIRVDAHVVHNRVSEAKRSASFYAVADWRKARTHPCAQCAHDFQDIYRTWEEATALPVPPLQEITPKPASPTASTRANAKANVVLRTCA